ncbi:hypothetical protein L484_017275 [Morus notabilis]|uniref:Uncharacterized protein n=1 Tax=Morus notabilis TaxID=981085 RepID=W9S3C3_9ROSA|nr:hypothetical protein L484_017275 [Morus notabilis]
MRLRFRQKAWLRAKVTLQNAVPRLKNFHLFNHHPRLELQDWVGLNKRPEVRQATTVKLGLTLTYRLGQAEVSSSKAYSVWVGSV